MTIEREPIRWDLDLSPMIDVPVIIETQDGGKRRTMITDIGFADVSLLGMICPLPAQVFLENDLNDWIDVRNIKSVVKIVNG